MAGGWLGLLGIGGGCGGVSAAGLAEATWMERRLHSAAYGREIAFRVWLPPGYDARATHRHPVVYCLADRGEPPERPAVRTAVVEEAVRSGIFPPFIVVYFDTGSDIGYQDLPAGGSPAATCLTKELIPHVDRTWRTTGDRGGRAVVGVGSGGWGAIRLAVTAPELVGSAVSIDGEFRTLADVEGNPALTEWVRSVYGGDVRRFAEAQPAALVRRRAAEVRDRVGMLLLAGRAGKYAPGHDEFRAACVREQIGVRQEDLRGGVLSAIDRLDAGALRALEFVAGGLDSARSPDRDGPWVNAPTNTLLRVEHHVFYSRRLERPVGYLLYRPASWAPAPGAPLPVIYHLHGWGETERSSFDAIAYLDAAVQLGDVPPMAWAWPYGGKFGWYTDSRDGRVPVASVLAEEFVPHLERRWNLGGARERRALEGAGMGGYGALRLAAIRPGRFGAVLVHQPELPDALQMQTRHPDTWLTVFEGDPGAFAAAEPLGWLSRGAGELKRTLSIRLVRWTGGRWAEDGLRLQERLAALGMAVDVRTFEGRDQGTTRRFAAAGLGDFQWLARAMNAGGDRLGPKAGTEPRPELGVGREGGAGAASDRDRGGTDPEFR